MIRTALLFALFFVLAVGVVMAVRGSGSRVTRIQDKRDEERKEEE